jgi:hypothetical protein
MAAFFIIVAMILYNRDKEKLQKPDMMSAFGVSAIATIFVALIGTFIKIIEPDIFIEILVIGFIFIVIWLLKK